MFRKSLHLTRNVGRSPKAEGPKRTGKVVQLNNNPSGLEVFKVFVVFVSKAQEVRVLDCQIFRRNIKTLWLVTSFRNFSRNSFGSSLANLVAKVEKKIQHALTESAAIGSIPTRGGKILVIG